jgi:hypothetical protein
VQSLAAVVPDAGDRGIHKRLDQCLPLQRSYLIPSGGPEAADLLHFGADDGFIPEVEDTTMHVGSNIFIFMCLED